MGELNGALIGTAMIKSVLKTNEKKARIKRRRQKRSCQCQVCGVEYTPCRETDWSFAQP